MSSTSSVSSHYTLLQSFVITALLVTAAVLVLPGPGFRSAQRNAAHVAQDAGPPEDVRYQTALQQGLTGDLPSARAAFEQLARDERGSVKAAWALYQASLAARAVGDDPGAEALLTELRRDYAEHPLALRVEENSAPAAVPSRLSDCGPRALQWLAAQAGIVTDLADLRNRCGTDESGTTLAALANAAGDLGFEANAAQVDHWFLIRHRSSGIAWVDGDHYVAFLPTGDRNRVRVMDPNESEPVVEEVETLVRRSQGVVLLLAWGEKPLPRIRK
jgi:hypothetical protein